MSDKPINDGSRCGENCPFLMRGVRIPAACRKLGGRRLSYASGWLAACTVKDSAPLLWCAWCARYGDHTSGNCKELRKVAK